MLPDIISAKIIFDLVVLFGSFCFRIISLLLSFRTSDGSTNAACRQRIVTICYAFTPPTPE